MKKMAVRYSSITFKGRRENNEDRVICEICKKYKRKQMVFAAADGMGGYEKGDTAAEMMIGQLKKLNKKELPAGFSKTANIVRTNIEAVNRLIYEKSAELESGQMGTTVSGALVIGNLCLFFNVGDSRTYLVDAAGIRQITRDHSADMESLKKGIIREDEVGKGYYSHALTRCIGTDPEVEVDIFPSADFYILKQGEMIFCCTDGLWNAVSGEDIQREMTERDSLEESMEALAALAYQKGANDNISMAAFEYGRIPGKHSIPLKYLPIPDRDKKAQQRKHAILSVFLVTSIIAFLAVTVLLVFIFARGARDNPASPSPAGPFLPKNFSVPGPGVKQYKPGSHGGHIRFSLPAGTYTAPVRVRLTYESLTSINGDMIDSVVYYTTNGKEPDRESGKKYRIGETIVFNTPGRYTVKVKLFSTVGKYESKVYSREYRIVGPGPRDSP